MKKKIILLTLFALFIVCGLLNYQSPNFENSKTQSAAAKSQQALQKNTPSVVEGTALGQTSNSSDLSLEQVERFQPLLETIANHPLVEPPRKIHYFDAPVVIQYDHNQVAIQDAEAVVSSLAEFGFTEDDLKEHPHPEWSYLQLDKFWDSLDPSTLSSNDKDVILEALVAILAKNSEIPFISPTLVDNFGLPMSLYSELLVGISDSVTEEQHGALMAQIPHMVEASYADDHSNSVIVRVDTNNGFELIDIANELAQMSEFSYAEPNFNLNGKSSDDFGIAQGVALNAMPEILEGSNALSPNDPNYSGSGGWGLHNTGQSGGTVDFDMDAAEAWDLTTGSSSVIVVVIDNGIQANHPDLTQWSGNGSDFTPDNNPTGAPVSSYDNHGTAVAGCISGRINNGLGGAGVAPNVQVASARPHWNGTSGGSFSTSSTAVTNAINWAQTIGAKVTVNSNGYGFSSSAVSTAYQNTRTNGGITHFAATGNSGAGSISYPASLSMVLAVGASQRNGTKASFSQYGTGLSFLAPGASVATTDRTGSSGYASGDYATVNGTSFATPYAGGVAALLYSYNSSITPDEVTSIMESTAVDMGASGYDTTNGWGHINAFSALSSSGLTFTSHPYSSKIKLKWTSPTNAGMANDTVYIRMSTSGIPETSSDGTQVYSGTASEFEHTGLTPHQTYYYKIWGNDGSSYADFIVNNEVSEIALSSYDHDITWRNTSGKLVTWYVDDHTRLTSKTLSHSVTSPSWELVTTEDFNNDGDKDLLWHNQSSGNIVVWYMDGAERVSVSKSDKSVRASTGWELVDAKDFNGDGSPDLLWHKNTGRIIVWYMNGMTKLSVGEVDRSIPKSSGWRIKGACDLNGDLKPDVVWHKTSGRIVYWYMDGVTKQSTAALSNSVAASTTWELMGAKQMDDNSTADLIWHRPSGRIVNWYMTGTTRSSTGVYSQNVAASRGWSMSQQ